MEFLNNFILPQSAEHIELLHYMLLLILFLFIPFISILFGGSLFSVIYRRRGEKRDDQYYLRLAKEIIETTTINKSVGVILGIVPIFTAILIYSQLLHDSQISNLNYLLFAFIFVSIALVFIYSYRYSLSFNRIFNSFSEKESISTDVIDDVHILSDESERISKKAGIYGLIFLFLGLWFFVTALTIPTIYADWKIEDFIAGLFSGNVLARFALYLFFAVALTGGMILFTFLEEEKKKRVIDKDYSNFVKQKIVRVTFFVSFFIPLLLVICTFSLPESSLTGTVFFYSIVSIILLFLGYHLLYLLTKEIKGTVAALLLLTFIFSVASFIISDQKAMATATKFHSASLSAQFDEYFAELKGDGKTVAINAAELYQVKCASCHKWDQKLVGPPHLEVLPKYVGKEQQLEAFIRNPSKVNPEYPQMPNPGLKPNEAKALAKYLLETYSEKTK